MYRMVTQFLMQNNYNNYKIYLLWYKHNMSFKLRNILDHTYLILQIIFQLLTKQRQIKEKVQISGENIIDYFVINL